MGLAANGESGAHARWSLELGSFMATGVAQVEVLPGLQMRGTTDPGVLILDEVRFATPVTWDYMGGSGTDVAGLAGFTWQEIIYGLTSIPGSAVGLFKSVLESSPLVSRDPAGLGVETFLFPRALGLLLVPLSDGVHYRVQTINNRVNLVPVRDGSGYAVPWISARADQRNSGAYPLPGLVAASPLTGSLATSLQVFPNPGSGQFHFRLHDGDPGRLGDLLVYDLRGRLVKRLRVLPGEKSLGWDGRDSHGRAVAAGTYLVTAGQGDHRITTRFVLTR